MIERNNYPTLGAPVGPYVHGVRFGDLLFLSGLTAHGTAAQTQGIAAQAEATLRRIEAVALAEGATLSALLKVTLYVTTLEHIAELRATLQRIYGAHLPASTLVQVQALFAQDLSVEIDAVLALPPRPIKEEIQ
jgi:2-iminobutanoate/2-iminopropanoate deaminase